MISKFQINFKLKHSFWITIVLCVSFLFETKIIIHLLTHFHFNKRKLSVSKIRMIGAITAGYCHFGGTRCKWYYEAILSHKDKDDDYDKGEIN